MFIYLYLNFCIKKGKRKKNYDLPPSSQSSKIGAEDAFFASPVMVQTLISYIYIYINEFIEQKIAPSAPYSHRSPGTSRFKCMEQGELSGAIPSKVVLYIYIYIYIYYIYLYVYV